MPEHPLAGAVFGSLGAGSSRSGAQASGPAPRALPGASIPAAADRGEGRIGLDRRAAQQARPPAPARREAARLREQLAFVLEASSYAIWEWDLRTDAVDLSPRWSALLGYETGELAPTIDSWLAVLDPAERPRAAAEIAALRAHAADVIEGEYLCVTKGGERRWLRSRSRVMERDAAGRPLRLLGADTDVTARKAVEAERDRLLARIEAERSLLEAVLQHLPTGVVVAEAPSGRVLLANEQVARIWRRDEMPTDPAERYRLNRLFRPDGRPYAFEERPMYRALRGHTTSAETIAIGRGDGTLGTVRCNAAPVRDALGRIVAGVLIVEDITERERADEALRASEERLRLALEAAGASTWSHGIGSDEVHWSPQVYAMLGLDPAAVRPSYDAFCQRLHPDDRARVLADMRDLITSDEHLHEREFRIVRPDGATRHLLAWARLHRDANGQPARIVGINVDITARKAAEAAAHAATERMSLALAAGQMGTWEWDVVADRHVWDDQVCRLFGVEPGRPPASLDELRALVRADDWQVLLEAGRRAAESGQPVECEYRVARPDGADRWIAQRCAATCDAAGRLLRMTGVSYDTTDRKAAEQRIQDLALNDALTGLPNRRMLQQLLTRELAHAARAGGAVALLIIDLDRFKEVNDTFGHPAGDALLATAGERLKASVREGEVVARLGGDEFAVLIAAAQLDEGRLAALAQRILSRLTDPFTLEGGQAQVGASIGIAPWPGHAGDAESLLRHADLALYAAKGAGRGAGFPARDAGAGHRAGRARPWAAACAGPPRARAALPADRLPRPPRAVRARGPGPLAPPGARAAGARPLPARGRARRVDRAAHRSRARGGAAPGGRLGRGRAGPPAGARERRPAGARGGRAPGAHPRALG